MAQTCLHRSTASVAELPRDSAAQPLSHSTKRTALWLCPLFLFALLGATAAPNPVQLAYRHARQLADQGDSKQAAAAVDDALRKFGSSADDAVWSLRVLRAEVLLGSGHPEDAVAALAFTLPAKLQNGEIAIRRLMTLGLAHARAGRVEQGEKLLRDAEALAVKSLPRMRADVQYRRASVATRAGRLDEAAAILSKVLAAARARRDRTLEANALGTLLNVRGRQERYDEAMQAGERALVAARAAHADASAAIIEGNLGWISFALGDYERATELLTAADARSAALGSTASRITWALQLGNVAQAQRDYVAARKHYLDAAALAQQLNDNQYETALANLAVVEIATGDYAAAAQHNREALERKRKRGDREAELHSLLTDGRIAVALGRTNEAESLFRKVAGETSSKSLRWEAEARLGQLYARLHRNDDADAQFRRALDTATDARDDVKSEDLRLSFQTTVTEFYDEYIDFLVATNRKLDALRIAELGRGRTLAEGLKLPEPGTSFDPQRIAADAGAVILAYWLAPSRSYVWAIDARGVELFVLPSDAAIDRALDRYQRELLGPRGTLVTSGAHGAELYRMLVEPAARLVPRNARVAIVPDGRLDAFNMETLVVPGARPRYWIEDVTIQTASSLQLLARPRASRDAATMLLIGNAPQPDASFLPLPHAGAELARVRRHFAHATTLEGARATPRAYASAEPERFAYLHFVAHGVANRVRPLDSAVVLARDGESYKLYARDIVQHPLRARLVTISSCHGAGKRAYDGEGLVGLAWAFLRAGAHEVIAALWEVNDSATPELMDAMYAGIRAGRDPAAALRDAKLQLLRSNGVYRRPLYWAPFVLYSGS